ncbi:MAG: ABC transporter ATP-binding protein [Chloroflexota bacterium]
MTKIQINDLNVTYLGRKTAVLSGVNLSFNPGETVLLLGASGSGKSTLALTCNGLIPHSLGTKMTGQVLVDDLDTQVVETAALSQKVGIVFQDPEAQFVTLKVEDEILFGLENLKQPPETMSAKVDDALGQVEMASYRLRSVDQLSGGQKQRIAFASLLAMEPQLIIFDEPTANLDPVGTDDVFNLLAEIKAQGKHTLILIEHKLDSLMHLIDRVVVLGSAGEILADGSPQQVFFDKAALLKSQGIWMPEITQLATQLQQQGRLPAEAKPLTIPELLPHLESLALEPDGAASEQSSDENPPVIQINGLTFSYGETAVLQNINLDILQGEFLAIVGANGAGKTTLAQLIAGILQPSDGTIEINSQSVQQIRNRDLAKFVGYVFQNPEHQFITNFVFDEVAYSLRVAGLAETAVSEKGNALLEQFGLMRYAKASPFTLSHGEKRRLSVATMLAMGQDVLILDEPTFGQDQKNADTIMELLTELNQQGKTIIMITHDMKLVAEYATQVVVMSNGRKLTEDKPSTLFNQPDILRQANLTPPPITQLAQQLATQNPNWAPIYTLNQLVKAFSENTNAIGQTHPNSKGKGAARSS